MIEVDAALIKAAKSGEEDAKDKIIRLFKKKVEIYAQRYYLIGGERSDLAQEGYLGLSRAVEQFEESKGNFAAFALACVNNQMKNSVKKSMTLKNRILNESVPFEAVGSEDGFFVGDSPETLYLRKEKSGSLSKMINEKLSPLEKKVAVLFIKGFDYGEIAKKTGKDVKAVGNALSRSRSKLSAALKEQK